ncbi:MAG: 50S ribosomal protein L22 [Aigarchaeota archaeon]|nr:50S ribosomal protein L22 [Aigarchaeota archaeon]MDW8092200.1 50S ribosomal protein L22 [Nitrososphaerota archaeon]
MPRWGYSITGLDPMTTVKASLREVDLSPKWTREVCNAIKGMRVVKAREYLERVVEGEEAVPYRRYKKLRAHRRGVRGPGGYPVKAARHLLKLLDSLSANAEFKGLDPERLVITHAVSHKGRALKRFTPRAFGRASPRNKVLVHIELAATQV